MHSTIKIEAKILQAHHIYKTTCNYLINIISQYFGLSYHSFELSDFLGIGFPLSLSLEPHIVDCHSLN